MKSVEEKVIQKILDTISEDSDEEEEVFTDASDGEAVTESKSKSNLYDGQDFKNSKNLEEALEGGRQMMIQFINNQFDEAVTKCFEMGKTNMIYAAGMGAIKTLEGCLTLNPSHLKEAITYMKFASEYANCRRKKQGYTSFLFKQDYNNFTDEECHAELIYAETLIAVGLLSIVEDQGIYGLVNAALTIRASHQTYKECVNILNLKSNWGSDNVQMHFESGTRLGIGAFDLFVSMFPNKLAKLLEMIGFCGDRDLALAELNKSVDLPEGLLYDISSILLSVFYGFVEFFYGCGEVNAAFFEKQSKVWQRRTPNSSIAKIGLALWEQITGNPDQAITYYTECVFGSSIWKQLHLASYWGIVWCYTMKCDWTNAAKYIKLLKDECKWSPAMFTYLYAVFLYMVMEEENRPELKEEISQCLKKVPQLKRTVGGKKVFHERIVIERSKRFHDRVEDLLLPPLELCYLWNVFQMMNGKSEIIMPFMDRIQSKLDLHLNDKEIPNKCLDRYSYLTFMRGVCYRHLGYPLQAIECFEDVLSCKKRIEIETHLMPQSAFELGIIHRKAGQYNEAKKWLKKARDDYSGYLTEIMIQYRANHVLDKMKQEMKDQLMTSER